MTDLQYSPSADIILYINNVIRSPKIPSPLLYLLKIIVYSALVLRRID